MAYDEMLAGRIHSLLARRQGLMQRKMFGGVAFMLNGNMCCGALKNELIVRVKPEAYEAAMTRPHVRCFDFTGRPMKGFVVVLPKGYAADKSLKDWIEMGVKCARSLPVKISGAKPRKKYSG